MLSYRHLGFAFSLVGVAACGGAAGKAARPDAPTVGDALGEKVCHDVSGPSEPLVVDWKPEQRGDLELAMREGVAVVAYSCEGIRLLRDCKLEGSYGYMGVTRKEQVISLSDSDEVQANLPLSGASLSAELKSGASLDVAMVLVGQQKTTWTSPTTGDLKGSCDGATHYVRGATVGAFALATSTGGEAKAVASFFGAGASGESKSTRATKNKEGDLTSCQAASPKAAAPPDQCGAPVRLLIAPIAKADAKPAAAPVSELAQRESQCPQGLVFAEGKCTKAASAAAYQCKPGDAAECEAQCEKGSAGSCGALGVLLAEGGTPDDTRAAQLFHKACEAGDIPSCTNLGQFKLQGRGVSKDDAEAAKLFEKACLEGDALACGLLAETTTDLKLAANLFKQACAGGHTKSCTSAARAFAAGNGVAQDRVAAVELYKKGCFGADGPACLELGQLFESSPSGADLMQARMFYERGCNFGHAASCTERGRAELSQPGGGGSADQAKGFFERGCQRQDGFGCAVSKLMYGGTAFVNVSPAQQMEWRSACTKGDLNACTRQGVVEAASGMGALGKATLTRACTGGRQFACAVLKAAKL